jgi:hypothetical protein
LRSTQKNEEVKSREYLRKMKEAWVAQDDVYKKKEVLLMKEGSVMVK